MAGVAADAYPRSTLPPDAQTADVVVIRVGQENVAATIDRLQAATDLPTKTSQRGQVRVAINRHQHVKILRLGVRVRYRADKRNTLNTRELPGNVDEHVDHFKHFAANWRLWRQLVRLRGSNRISISTRV